MKIRDVVRSDLIFLDLEATDAGAAIDEVSREASDVVDLDAETVAEALKERETLGSTSVGNEFAIPHCKLTGVDDIIVILARFTNGIDFGGNNHHVPVRFFFVVLSPPDRPAEHLKVLSQIARILKSGDLRRELLQVEHPEAVIDAIGHAAEAEGL
jgi:mannitol/fructose-specific phosphotransferase system IIA component (Ntr-type)